MTIEEAIKLARADCTREEPLADFSDSWGSKLCNDKKKRERKRRYQREKKRRIYLDF